MARVSKRRRYEKVALVRDAATSQRLSQIRQHGTGAEISVRSCFRRLGMHFSAENRDLPGSPDLANRRQRFAVFVHGCFWHRHSGCSRTTTPKRNREFWLRKFDANIKRDARVIRELRSMGFLVMIIWECETMRPAILNARVAKLAQRLANRAS
jgi:DNA mismatch endonuclease (patch repair protein)